MGMRVHDASALAELLVCSAEEEAAAAISLGETLAVCGRAGAVMVMPVHALGPEHVSVQSSPSGQVRDSP